MIIPTSKSFFFLNLIMQLGHAARVSQPNQVTAAKACQEAADVPLCLDLLNSRPQINDLKQAAFVAFQAASAEAVQTSQFIKSTREKEEGKEVTEDSIEEETLADCSQNYGSIAEIMAEATNALMSGPEADVSVEIKAAIATAETCGKSIREGKKSRQVEEVAKKNEHVIKLCSNALSVYNVYATT
ncbi:uncharacterized protein LOC112511956 [Cynara cardunculus var. scolymus]|uniref:uncharacterized protein LOC112511956 n=1 Tax=Cynara cardunculus var. scolymus TaxID=59895 RepID=UPI000D6250B0|nr:uncharacterized protein LOC112511956 [Cynara cardunculus var. scolymus]